MTNSCGLPSYVGTPPLTCTLPHHGSCPYSRRTYNSRSGSLLWPKRRRKKLQTHHDSNLAHKRGIPSWNCSTRAQKISLRVASSVLSMANQNTQKNNVRSPSTQLVNISSQSAVQVPGWVILKLSRYRCLEKTGVTKSRS